MYLKKQVVFLEVHLRVVFLGGNGELDLQAVENGGERAQVRHQAGNSLGELMFLVFRKM